MKTTYSRRALRDIEHILAYIAEHNQPAAKDFGVHLQKVVSRIGLFPYGARRGRMNNVRILPLLRYPYVIIYAVNDAEQEIKIVRVRHEARKPLKRFS